MRNPTENKDEQRKIKRRLYRVLIIGTILIIITSINLLNLWITWTTYQDNEPNRYDGWENATPNMAIVETNEAVIQLLDATNTAMFLTEESSTEQPEN